MEFSISKAGIVDKNFILKANKKIDEESFIEFSELKNNINKDLFDEEKAICLICKNEERYAGVILFSKVYWADRGEGIYVSQVYVSPKYRNRGLLKFLFESALNFFEDTNFLTCLVAKDNDVMNKCMEKMHFENENMLSYVKNKSDF